MAEAKAATPSLSRRQGPWLHAWHDPVAGLFSFPSCICVADLSGDGDHSLLVACSDRRLRVCKGTMRAGEHTLVDTPVACAVFHADERSPRMPAAAVASGSSVYVYRSLRPYFKFALPKVDIAAEEIEIWDKIRSGEAAAGEAVASLEALRDSGVRLSSRSADLLLVDPAADPEGRTAFCEAHKGLPLEQKTLVTCMSTMNKNDEAEGAVSSLVVGTEHGQVLILDPPGSSIAARVQLPSTPTMLAVTGLFDVEWRIIVACRDGKLYTMKSGEVRGSAVCTRNVIELSAQPVGLVRSEALIYVGTMDARLRAYSLKGRPVLSLDMPRPITNMAPMRVKRSLVVSAVLVALEGGEVRCYREKKLVAVVEVGESVTALHFGHYGRADNTLVCVTKSGGLVVKMLQRTASLEGDAGDAKAPAEQDVALDVPKKTRLYVEQQQRELEMAGEMHRAFQSDLCHLRLEAARAYVKLLTDGGVSAAPSRTGATVRLDASVVGVGPRHRLQLRVANTGAKALTGVLVMFNFDAAVYKMDTGLLRLPALVPGVVAERDAWVTNVHPQGLAAQISALILQEGDERPLLHYLVTMPQSELADDN